MSPITVILKVRENTEPSRRGYIFDILADGEVLSREQAVSTVESQEVKDLTGQYAMLFEKRYSPDVIAGTLELLGSGLFRIWFRRSHERLMEIIGEPDGKTARLVIASDLPEVLSLPWELTALDGLRLIVSRCPKSASTPALAPPASGPFRIHFSASSPSGLPRIDFDSEEERSIVACEEADIALSFSEMGTFDELSTGLSPQSPHALHLSGHLIEKGDICFAFEDERGMQDLRPAEEIVRTAPWARFFIVNGRGIEATGRFCQQLVAAGAPAAVAIGADLGNSAVEIFGSLYRMLAAGDSVEEAVFKAGETARNRSEPAWTLLAAYSTLDRGCVQEQVAAGRDREKAGPVPGPKSEEAEQIHPVGPLDQAEAHAKIQRSLPYLVGGSASPFIDRRRILNRLLPALKDGSLRALIITGRPGSGKSALATRLALEIGHKVIPLAVTDAAPLCPSRLLDACGQAFLLHAEMLGSDPASSNLKAIASKMADGRLPVGERLKQAVSGLNLGKFILLIDGLDTGKDVDQEMAGFYAALLKDLDSGRTIITCQSLPVEIPRLGSGALNEWIGELSDSVFLRFLLFDHVVAKRYREGSLKTDLLSKISYLIGRSPQFYEIIRSALRDMPADMLLAKLEKIALPSDVNARHEAQKRAAIEIFASWLYCKLSPESQAALARSAVLEIPAKIELLSVTAGVVPDALSVMMKDWKDCGFLYESDQDSWVVCTPLRSWLTGLLDTDQVRAAHRAIGSFLRNVPARRLDSMLEARHHYLKSGNVEDAIDVTSRISNYMMRRGLYDDLIRINEGLDDPGSILRAGIAHLHKAEYDLARNSFEAALLGYRNAGDRHGEASALHNLGFAALREEDLTRAKSWFQEALVVYKEVGDIDGQSSTLYNLGMIAMQEQDNEEARMRLDEALIVQREAGDKGGEAATLQSLAMISLRDNDESRAREELDMSLSIYKEIGDPSGEAAALGALASIDLQAEKSVPALEKLRRVQSLLSNTGDLQREGDNWLNIASAQQQLGDRDGAWKSLVNAVEIYREVEDRNGEAAALFQLGVMAVWMNRIEDGIKILVMATSILRALERPELKKVEPLVEQLAAQLKLSEEQFVALVRDAGKEYRRDRGKRLIERVFDNR